MKGKCLHTGKQSTHPMPCRRPKVGWTFGSEKSHDERELVFLKTPKTSINILFLDFCFFLVLSWNTWRKRRGQGGDMRRLVEYVGRLFYPSGSKKGSLPRQQYWALSRKALLEKPASLRLVPASISDWASVSWRSLMRYIIAVREQLCNAVEVDIRQI